MAGTIYGLPKNGSNQALQALLHPFLELRKYDKCMGGTSSPANTFSWN